MLKGLLKMPTAPASSTRSRISASIFPETKIIGMGLLKPFSRCCSSMPLIPGKSTSRMRQSDSATRPESRYASAEVNASTSNPASLIILANIRHIDRSSSTTEIKRLAGNSNFSSFNCDELNKVASDETPMAALSPAASAKIQSIR